MARRTLAVAEAIEALAARSRVNLRYCGKASLRRFLDDDVQRAPERGESVDEGVEPRSPTQVEQPIDCGSATPRRRASSALPTASIRIAR